jgi:hypothetical protein
MMTGILDMEEDSSQKWCVTLVLRYTTQALHQLAFFLLAVFRRSSFWLTEESVGLALHSILGGSLGGFHLGCIKPCHFHFSVASKEVGFMITAMKRITTAFFDVYFHLWWDGGPNWRKELCKWEEEEDSCWMFVTRKLKSKSRKYVHFASPIHQKSPSPKPSYVMDPHALKFGGFHCPFNLYHDVDAKLKSSMFHDHSCVPITKFFGSIKNKFIEAEKEKLRPFSNPSCSAASAPNQSLDLR